MRRVNWTERERIAEGQRSRQIGLWNLRAVLLAIGYESEDGVAGLTFSELEEETKFLYGKPLSRQRLGMHLRKLKEANLIYEDTVKPWDNVVQPCGEVVFKVVKNWKTRMIFNKTLCCTDLTKFNIPMLFEK
jgi:hypothetical protein